jgi:hypothetical protein
MMQTKTFEQFQEDMIFVAKAIQGPNYPGDEYYRQGCWREAYEQGATPSDAVSDDMTYWDAGTCPS